MTLATWWIFVVTEIVLCLTPGPAVLCVLSSALKAGSRRAVASVIGILTANTAYFALSATGVGVLLASSKLFQGVKWAGAAFLVYLGLRLMFSRPLARQRIEEPRSHHLFFQGFMLQISNPKAVIFFAAFLPQFLHPGAPVVPQVAILAVTSVVIEFAILSGYAMAAGRAAMFAIEPRYAKWTSRIAGGLLMAAGAGLASR
jgi:homoserine/homoserine lactone efflux protein